MWSHDAQMATEDLCSPRTGVFYSKSVPPHRRWIQNFGFFFYNIYFFFIVTYKFYGPYSLIYTGPSAPFKSVTAPHITTECLPYAFNGTLQEINSANRGWRTQRLRSKPNALVNITNFVWCKLRFISYLFYFTYKLHVSCPMFYFSLYILISVLLSCYTPN